MVPALLINLGLMPFILDEATRADVALEMIFSGNYITPTITGEYYYNKPPLFNWILVLFVKAFGTMDEWVFRLPTVLSLSGFALTIYLTAGRRPGRLAGFLAAFAMITSGRLLFYDSMKGLIDITFSWIIYSMMMVICFQMNKEKYFRLFIFSYLLAAMAFLMKGLPALVFQGISLLTVFIARGRFRKLFSLSHLSGILVFIALVGSYYLAYSRHHSVMPVLERLWSESATRTPLENPVSDSILHLFTFPFEFIKDFMPWTLMVVFLFEKGRLKKFIRDPFLKYNMLLFLVNILVYWVSPGIYPRYLFMFLPLFFVVTGQAYLESNREGSVLNRVFDILFLVAAILAALLPLTFPLIERISPVPHAWLKSLLLFAGTSFLAAGALLVKKRRIVFLMAVILALRIGFNWFILPERYRNAPDVVFKNMAVRAGGISRGEELVLFDGCIIQDMSVFYIMRERKQILVRKYGDAKPGILYIVDEDHHPDPPWEIFYEFRTPIESRKLMIIEPAARQAVNPAH